MIHGDERIAAERRRQFAVEDYDANHDNEHANNELARAAAYYALPAPLRPKHPNPMWPWSVSAFKPGSGIAGRIRDLEKAGALIAAEIDRIQRMSVGEALSRMEGR
jgi:hypothetical protein